ncbi:MAG TPA: energy transducer TonB [Stellaceae bacterium]|nr:energy transducer TonB [Stellaceae bacterium]
MTVSTGVLRSWRGAQRPEGEPIPYARPRPNAARGARLIGAGFVILLHVAFVYALVTSLAHRTVDVVRAPVEARIIDEAKEQKPEQPPPPPPVLSPPPAAFVPPPEVHVELPPPPPKSTAITVVAPVKPVPTPAPPAPAPVAEPVRVMPRLDIGHSHEPEYPPTSRRLGEEGSLILQVLVGADGRVTDSKLVQTSGFDRLDQAALAGVKGNYRFVPGTIDGKPAPMWFTFRFTWKLR